MPYLSSDDLARIETLRLQNAKRGRRYKRIALGVALFGAVAIILIVVLSLLFNPLLLGPLIMLGVGFEVVALVFYIYGRNFLSDYQRRVYAYVEETLGRRYFGEIVYAANRGLDQRVIDHTGFFAIPDRYLGTFYLAGRSHDLPFEKGHYVLQRKQQTKNGTTYSTYQEGTMYRFKLQRNLRSLVRIVEKRGARGYVARGSVSEVETEYIAFNEKFAVLSNDPSKALYVLTPKVMETIMDLERRFSGLFDLAFIDDEFYLSIADGTDAYAKLPTDRPLGEEDLEALARRIALPSSLVEALAVDEGKFSALP